MTAPSAAPHPDHPSHDAPVRTAAQQQAHAGHYFDQTVFDLHYSLQSARARSMALEADLATMGVRIDPATGVVHLMPVKPAA